MATRLLDALGLKKGGATPPATSGGSVPVPDAEGYSPVNLTKPAYLDPSSPEMRNLLQDLFKDADTQIKALYKPAGDKGIRSIEDAEALNKKMQEVMKPVEDAAKKAKTLKTRSEISATFGFGIQGDWLPGGKASPPAAVFGTTIHF